MNELMLIAVGFFFGIAAGQVILVYQATRPNGYRAMNGNRYRLERVPARVLQARPAGTVQISGSRVDALKANYKRTHGDK